MKATDYIKIDSGLKWIFPNEMKEDSGSFEIINVRQYDSAKGSTFPIIEMDGQYNGRAGSFNISFYSADVSELINKFGEETDNWKGKHIVMKKNGSKALLLPMEDS